MKLLVTGATGFLGSYLVPELLNDGHKITALVRKSVLDIPDIAILRGDITKRGLGLEHKLAVLAIDAIVHCAGEVSFANKDKALVRKVNLVGTSNVADLAASLGVPLYHISTVYVCGDYKNTFTPGMLDVNQGFNNFYEESKYQAERLLASNRWPVLTYTIIRPSILVGDSIVKGIPPLMGFYAGIRGIYLAKRWLEHTMALPPIQPVIRLRADPDATLNMIPVDLAAKQIGYIIRTRPLGTHHVVNLNPPLIKDVLEAASKAIGAKIIAEKVFAPNPAEQLVAQMAGRLMPYLQGEASFESRAPVSLRGDIAEWEAVQCNGLSQDFIEQTTRKFLLDGTK